MPKPVDDRTRLQVAVIGAGSCGARQKRLASEVGALLARAGAVVVCGGRGGVMAAASRGARQAGVLAVGILPAADAAGSPPARDLGVAVFTGMGQARNLAVVASSAAVVAVGGGWGTLSEIALALKHRIPVVTLESWTPRRPDGAPEPLLHAADSAERAVALALELADRERLG